MSDTRPLMIRPTRRREPGIVLDCFTCTEWRAGSVVLRGNTQGRCNRLGLPAGADEFCPEHTPRAEA